MKVTVDLKMVRIFTLAEIKGNLDATLIAESATRDVVKKMLLKSFKRSKLRGTVFFDEERVEL